jgi:hypothetical protein
MITAGQSTLERRDAVRRSAVLGLSAVIPAPEHMAQFDPKRSFGGHAAGSSTGWKPASHITVQCVTRFPARRQRQAPRSPPYPLTPSTPSFIASASRKRARGAECAGDAWLPPRRAGARRDCHGWAGAVGGAALALYGALSGGRPLPAAHACGDLYGAAQRRRCHVAKPFQ